MGATNKIDGHLMQTKSRNIYLKETPSETLVPPIHAESGLGAWMDVLFCFTGDSSDRK